MCKTYKYHFRNLSYDRQGLIHNHMQHKAFQFSSVQSLSHVWLCDPTDGSRPGFPVPHQLPESTQTHVHCFSDAMLVMPVSQKMKN